MDFSVDDRWLFAIMVFAAVFLLVQSFIVPAFGENRRLRRQMNQRLDHLIRRTDMENAPSLLRRPRGPENWLRRIPGGDWLTKTLAQAGHRHSAGRVLVGWSGAALLVASGVTWILEDPLFGLAGAALTLLLMVMRVNAQRNRRINDFDEQLQDALGVMVRALRAGHPFTEAVRLVSTEIPAPAGPEFGIVFAEVNYGGDLRRALLGLLSRVPSVTVMAMVTAVLVQRETGGNLAETLEKIAAVIRGRFRFQRRVRTLSAEAKLSAWVLTLMPFILFGAISVVNPDYLPMLVDDPLGRRLVLAAFVLIVIGIVWMRQMMRIRV